MNDAQLESFGRSALYAAIAAVVMAGVQFAVMLSGDGDLLWRPIAATFMTTFFGALAVATKTINEPRPGSERLAAQVDALTARGVKKRDMKVVPTVGEIADELLARQRAQTGQPHG